MQAVQGAVRGFCRGGWLIGYRIYLLLPYIPIGYRVYLLLP